MYYDKTGVPTYPNGVTAPHIPADHRCSHLCSAPIHYARAEFVDETQVPDLRPINGDEP